MASPGGWSQVIVEELKLESNPFLARGRNEDKTFSGDGLLDEIYSMSLAVENCSEQEIKKNESGGSCVSCDLRPFRQVNGARQVIGDIFEKETLDQIVAQNEQRDFDLVVSGKRHENIVIAFCNVRNNEILLLDESTYDDFLRRLNSDSSFTIVFYQSF